MFGGIALTPFDADLGEAGGGPGRPGTRRRRPGRQPTSDSFEFAMKWGMGWSDTRSEIMTRPPGLSVRITSRRTPGRSAERFSTQFEMTASTLASPTGSASISPSRDSTFAKPPLSALARARSTISGVMSTPTTRPSGPTRSAARKQSNPAPEPRSSTVSPGASDARATGLPHPRPRFAPSGTRSSSSRSYPTARLMSSQQSDGPQHPSPGHGGPVRSVVLRRRAFRRRLWSCCHLLERRGPGDRAPAEAGQGR